MLEAINGRKVKEEKVLGYCSHKKHSGYLLKKEVNIHRCTEKRCPYFVKINNEKAWKEKDSKKRRYKSIKSV